MCQVQKSCDAPCEENRCVRPALLEPDSSALGCEFSLSKSAVFIESFSVNQNLEEVHQPAQEIGPEVLRVKSVVFDEAVGKRPDL